MKVPKKHTTLKQIAMAATNNEQQQQQRKKNETPIFQGRYGMFVDFETLVRIEIDSDFCFCTLVIGS